MCSSLEATGNKLPSTPFFGVLSRKASLLMLEPLSMLRSEGPNLRALAGPMGPFPFLFLFITALLNNAASCNVIELNSTYDRKPIGWSES